MGEATKLSREILPISSEWQESEFLSGWIVQAVRTSPRTSSSQPFRAMRSTVGSTGWLGQGAQALLAKTEKFLQRKRTAQLDINSAHAHLHLRRHFQ